MFKKLIVAVSIASLLFPAVALAHPGRTDRYGGHRCWTNCKKWGLKYGQYHYHRYR